MKFGFYIMNALSVIACLCVFLLKGGASRIPTSPKRIAIIQLAKMGDMVCTTPMFAAIKRSYPDAKLLVIGNEINRSLLEFAPNVDEYLVWPSNLLKAIQILKQAQVDVVCITGPGTESLVASYLAGVGAIICPTVVGGRSPYETKTYRLLKSLACVVEHRMGEYAPGEYLKLLKPLGIMTRDVSKRLGYSQLAKSKVADLSLSFSRPSIGITLSAGNKIKEWPLEKFLGLISKLVSGDPLLSVFIVGGKGDAHLADRVLQEIPLSMRKRVHDCSGKFTLDELKAFIAQLDIFIGVDTGPVYIAEAFGVATVDIVGPMDEREQPPIGERHLVVVPERIEPQLHIMNARVYDEKEALRQASAATVDEVYNAVRALLDGANTNV